MIILFSLWNRWNRYIFFILILDYVSFKSQWMSCKCSIINLISSVVARKCCSSQKWLSDQSSKFKIQQLLRIQAPEVFLTFAILVKQSVSACTKHKVSKKHITWWINFLPQINTCRRSIHPKTTKDLVQFFLTPFSTLQKSCVFLNQKLVCQICAEGWLKKQVSRV